MAWRICAAESVDCAAYKRGCGRLRGTAYAVPNVIRCVILAACVIRCEATIRMTQASNHTIRMTQARTHHATYDATPQQQAACATVAGWAY